MSLLSKWVFDPIKKLISSAKIVPELIDLASEAETIYVKSGPAGITDAIVDKLEGGLQAVVDDALTGAMTSLGPVGVALEPEALVLANEMVAWLKDHTNAVIDSLFSHATTAVAAQAAPAPAIGSAATTTA